MRHMPALPADAREPGTARLTGVTCPDCPGVLTVQADGRDSLVFVCRVGHTYSAEELVCDKEKRAELLLWAAVEALEELAALLKDTGIDGERARRALEESRLVRRLIDSTVPTELTRASKCAVEDGEG